MIFCIGGEDSGRGSKKAEKEGKSGDTLCGAKYKLTPRVGIVPQANRPPATNNGQKLKSNFLHF
jgi:hypothetical protein